MTILLFESESSGWRGQNQKGKGPKATARRPCPFFENPVFATLRKFFGFYSQVRFSKINGYQLTMPCAEVCSASAPRQSCVQMLVQNLSGVRTPLHKQFP